jgi:hypothetical protein
MSEDFSALIAFLIPVIGVMLLIIKKPSSGNYATREPKESDKDRFYGDSAEFREQQEYYERMSKYFREHPEATEYPFD